MLCVVWYTTANRFVFALQCYLICNNNQVIVTNQFTQPVYGQRCDIAFRRWQGTEENNTLLVLQYTYDMNQSDIPDINFKTIF